MSENYSNAQLRYQVLLRIGEKSCKLPEKSSNYSIESFGVNTFNDKVMREKLPKDVYDKLRDTIRKGTRLDQSIANTVAHAMKEWAISKGVSHFTHWFQPQTGLTAEKHDAFIEFDHSGVLERFRGSQLVQGEPDASSFPSGGLRTTFEARGYTAWDPSSPAFIMEGPRGGILCIPSVFISYNGEALDKKTPLLRSMEAINRSALKLLRLFGNTQATRVVTTVGAEQEYFLVDRAFYLLRPDLQIVGRTLQGARPPKGQELEDHYFGSIKERVLAFMQDAETELYKLGVPAKTRHNEVAPHQFEIAPIFSEANVAADRNHLTMEVLRKVAVRHGLALLLHEKPFAGINGSGKHNNWSMADSEGNNLLDPGKTPEQNMQFLVLVVAILRAVHKYGSLLRAAIAAAENDHRLGANEAPPAIISVFLGEQLNSILDSIKEGKTADETIEKIIDLGLENLPSILKHNTDRNRTSPFAFTGEKFEFRAIGSSASISLPNTMLSAAVAESIDVLVAEIEKKKTGGLSVEEAVLKVLPRHIKETEAIRFEGNNYSEEWAKEAERRGLPNVKRTAYAVDALKEPANLEMLLRQHVFSKEEIDARYHTKLEQYVRSIDIEAATFCDMLETRILPAAIRYESELLQIVKGIIELKNTMPFSVNATEIGMLKDISEKIGELKAGGDKIRKTVAKCHAIEDLSTKAKAFADQVVDLLETVRKVADEVEIMVPDDLWPLPKYWEMLFVM
jgi:glutamine synthetase